MEPIGYKETNKIKFCLHESGLFSRGLDRIVAQEISNNGDKVKYKIVIDNMPYLLEISKNEAASERIKRGSAVQRIMSRYNYAAIPFYVNPNGEFILTEYILGTLIDGWVHTGDLAEIDENGFVYIYGRCSDAIILSDNQKIYLFDIANKIKEAPFIDDCIVLQRNIGNDKNGLVAHIVWDRNYSEEEIVLFHSTCPLFII